MKKRIAIIFALALLLALAWYRYHQPDIERAAVKQAHYYTSPKQSRVFITNILPLVQKENSQILKLRHHILLLASVWHQPGQLTAKDQQWLINIASNYQLKHWDISQETNWQQLLLRVDVIPNSLVIAQAANESAWGQSRFAREGHNLFGQHCYTQNCGMIPRGRTADQHFEVTAFKRVSDSIHSYMLTLNSNSNYQRFRQIRQKLHQQHKALSGEVLAAGLVNYSARRDAYVTTIRQIIKHYHLSQYDQ